MEYQAISPDEEILDSYVFRTNSMISAATLMDLHGTVNENIEIINVVIPAIIITAPRNNLAFNCSK